MNDNSARSTQQSWFQGAPVTKLLCISWVVSHFLVSQQTTSSSSSAVPRQNVLLSKFLFGSTGEMVMGVLFLGQILRRLERELGSRKFLVWWLFVPSLTLALEVLLYSTTSLDAVWEVERDNSSPTSAQSQLLAPGPYVYMGGAMFWYYRYIPRLYPRFVSVGGLELSEKTIYYGWGFYVMASQGLPSLLSSTMGFLASALFFQLPASQTGSLPDTLVNALPWQSMGTMLFLDPPPPVYAPLLPPGGGASAGTANRAPRRPAPAVAAVAGQVPPPQQQVPPPPPPSDEAVDQLTAMGFEEERVRDALRQSDNNVEHAAHRLLMG